MSTSHTSPTAQQASRLLSLPAELRNSIYEYALADVQDNVCLDLEGGVNMIHRVVDKKPRSVPTEDRTSRLSLLLTCRQINTEASGIAFSKMRMSLDTVFPKPSDFHTRGDEALMEGSSRLSMIMASVTSSFQGTNLAAIPVMEFPSAQVLSHLTTFNSPGMDLQRANNFQGVCTAKCSSRSEYQGLIHHVFHNVKRIVIDGEDSEIGNLYSELTKGASWLSVLMQPYEARDVLGIFSNLEEIVVRRDCGEQVSKAIGDKFYAAESGMEMRGMDDWLPNIKVRRR